MMDMDRWSRSVATSLLNTPSFSAWLEPLIQLRRPRWSALKSRAQVSSVTRYGFGRTGMTDLVRFSLQPDSRWKGFLPGQHVMLTIEREGVLLSRPFSICSSPHHFKETGQIEFAVRRQDNGNVTTWLCDELQVGDWLQLSPALGEFILQDPVRPILLIGAGSGMAPLMSMVSEWASSSRFRAQLMMYTRVNEKVFASELAQCQLRGAESGMTSSFVYKAWETGQGGHFSLAQLVSFSPDFAERDIYVCGPAAMVRSVSALLAEQGVAPQRIHHELFFADSQAGASGGSAEVHISTVERGQVVKLAEGHSQSLLEVVEGAGYRPRYGCRQGICHECTCTKQSGRVRNRLTGLWSDTGEEEIQLCVSVPEGVVRVVVQE